MRVSPTKPKKYQPMRIKISDSSDLIRSSIGTIGKPQLLHVHFTINCLLWYLSKTREWKSEKRPKWRSNEKARVQDCGRGNDRARVQESDRERERWIKFRKDSTINEKFVWMIFAWAIYFSALHTPALAKTYMSGYDTKLMLLKWMKNICGKW